MRLLLLINRDFPSYYALERLLPLIQGQTVRVFQTAQVGAPRAVPRALKRLASSTALVAGFARGLPDV